MHYKKAQILTLINFFFLLLLLLYARLYLLLFMSFHKVLIIFQNNGPSKNKKNVEIMNNILST
jgi:hypothetical protein